MTDWKRLEKDGKTAVVYSPGYGGGWSSWSNNAERFCLDGAIAQAVLDDDIELASTLAFGTPCIDDSPFSFSGELVVQWVETGSRFEIDEYDGAESVRVFGKDDGFIA